MFHFSSGMENQSPFQFQPFIHLPDMIRIDVSSLLLSASIGFFNHGKSPIGSVKEPCEGEFLPLTH